jgi:hypothetical protein
MWPPHRRKVRYNPTVGAAQCSTRTPTGGIVRTVNSSTGQFKPPMMNGAISRLVKGPGIVSNQNIPELRVFWLPATVLCWVCLLLIATTRQIVKLISRVGRCSREERRLLHGHRAERPALKLLGFQVAPVENESLERRAHTSGETPEGHHAPSVRPGGRQTAVTEVVTQVWFNPLVSVVGLRTRFSKQPAPRVWSRN